MSKKDRYSHLGTDTDETSDEPEQAVDEEETEPEDTVDEMPDDEGKDDRDEADTSVEAVDVESDDESDDDLDDGTIRVTISDGDNEHEVVIDSEADVTTDDVVHAVQHAGAGQADVEQAETASKTTVERWVQMVSSLGKARLAAVAVVSLVAVKGLSMVARRLRRRD